MSILQEMFLPFDEHYDDGMRAMGDSFKEAADRLVEVEDSSLTFQNGHLPINYLYRHAIELYLKSAILTLHRFFNMPTCDGPHHPQAHIKIKKDWKPLDSFHSLKVLLAEVERLVKLNSVLIGGITPRCWATPPELTAAIDLIETTDGKSTYFRYPTGKGAKIESEKAWSQPADPEEVIADMHDRSTNGKRGRVVMAIKNREGEIVKMFANQEKPLAKLREALVDAVKITQGCAIGFNMEFVEGYGVKLFEWQAETEQKRKKSQTVEIAT